MSLEYCELCDCRVKLEETLSPSNMLGFGLLSSIRTTFINTSSLKLGGVFCECVRNVCLSPLFRSAYDPDGKTVVNILNNEEGAPLMINTYSVLGFRLNNNIFVIGPIAIFPHSVLSWDIKDDLDINKKSLSLFLNLSPKLDVLVIGLSDPMDHKLLVDTRTNIFKIINEFKRSEDRINIEVLPTEKAVTTFNFLNSEKRFVAAALLPPIRHSPTLDDTYRTEYLMKKKEEGDYLIGNPEDMKLKLK